MSSLPQTVMPAPNTPQAPAVKAKTGRKRSEARKEADDARRRFLMRKSFFQMEMNRQRANRFQMALDEDYYDNEQWTADERKEIESRGQSAVVFNEVKPVVDFMLGTERRTRVDGQVQNRFDNSPEAEQDAQNKTALLKLIDDINGTQFRRSDAADDCFKAGLGWIEVGVTADPTQLPIYKRAESWRHMLYDSLGQSKRTEDWRYLFRFREVDFDIAEQMVPADKVDLLRKVVINADMRSYSELWNNDPSSTHFAGALDGGLTGKWTSYDSDAWLMNPRERVMLIEAWTVEPRRVAGADGIDMPMQMAKRCAIMTEEDTIIESWSPYKHGRYPFVPLWCYRRKRDGAPYGMIRQHRGAQDSLNKQMSKAQFRMSARQIWLEEGALDDSVMDIDQLEDMAGDPTAILQFKKGALSSNAVQLKEGTALAQADIALADQYRATIRQSSGVSGEDRGLDHNEVSGKARQLRQQQGSLLTAEPFDNLLMAWQEEQQLTLSLSEQFHTEPMTFRIPGASGKDAWASINQPDPNNPAGRLNDITARQAHYIIGDAPWQQSLAEAAFEQSMDMLTQLASVAPNVVLAVLDIVFELHPNLPKKAQIVARIRQTTGQSDPDKPESPEVQAQKQQQQKLAQAQMEAQLAQLKADVAEAEQRGLKLNAEAVKTRLTALYEAAQAAQVLTLAPHIAPVADELAKSAGFQDQAGDAPLGAPVPVQPQPGQPIPDAQQGDGAAAGAQAGIQSPDLTGVQP